MFERYFVVFFISVQLITLSSCRKHEETVLTIIDPTKIDKESVASDSDTVTYLLGDLLFSPLLYLDKNGEEHNVLAEEIKVLPNKKVAEVKLREGVRFHDGKELTSHDIVSSVEQIKLIDEGFKNRYGDVKVEVLDKLRLKVITDSAVQDFQYLSRQIYAYKSLNGNLIGTGPFKFNRWLDSGIELVANEGYYEGRPKLDKIVYRYEADEGKRVYSALRGEADLLLFLTPEAFGLLERDDRFYTKKEPSDAYTALFLNKESPVLGDIRVRKAIDLAIDRDYIIKKALNGAGVKIFGPFPADRSFPENKAKYPQYAPKKAVDILKEAGWSDTNGDGILEKQGEKLGLKLLYSQDSAGEFKKIADIISQYLFEIGIAVEVVPSSTGDIRSKYMQSGGFDIVLDSRAITDGSFFMTWHSSSICRGGLNYSHYSNEVLDWLLEKLRGISDIKKKRGIYDKMQDMLEADTPAVFLYSPVSYHAVRKKFKGAEDFTGNVYSIYKIKDWSVNERVN